MTLVYDNATCEQAIFTYTFSGQNLNNDNLVFTVKKLVSNFKRDFPLLFKKMGVGQKNIILMNYWDFMFMVFIIIVLVVENWLIGLITMMNLLIIS